MKIINTSEVTPDDLSEFEALPAKNYRNGREYLKCLIKDCEITCFSINA